MLKAYYKGTNIKVRTGEEIRTSSGETMIFKRATRKTELGKSGKITTTDGMEYYAHIFNLEVREYDEYEEKTLFTNYELIKIVQSINDSIEKLLYEKLPNGEEIVLIDFITGHRKILNVTCNSLKSIALEVIRSI